MGEARRRGTFEQRKAHATQRDNPSQLNNRDIAPVFTENTKPNRGIIALLEGMALAAHCRGADFFEPPKLKEAKLAVEEMEDYY